MANLEIIDGRNPNRVPEHLSYDLFEFEHIATYDLRFCSARPNNDKVYCWLVDGMYVPVYFDAKLKQLFLCAQYKTFRGFNQWLARFYPLAYLEAGRK